MKQMWNELTPAGHTREGAARPSFEPGAAVARRENVCASPRHEGPVCHSWMLSREHSPSYDSWPQGIAAENHSRQNSATCALQQGARTKAQHAASEGGPPVLAAPERAREAGLVQRHDLRGVLHGPPTAMQLDGQS